MKRASNRPEPLRTVSLVLLLVPLLAATVAAGTPARYPAEPGLIEVVFAPDSRVRLRDGVLRDFAVPALTGVDATLSAAGGAAWERLSHVPEETVDRLRDTGIANTGRVDLPDLNNAYRLRVTDADVWDLAASLEELPGVASARPVPLPVPLPTPPAYDQEYRAPAAWNPSGTGQDYFDTAFNGTGAGANICDLEYSWNYDHADISKALTSQINVNVADPFGDDNHGTAVIGVLSADDNGWGVTGLCRDASLQTCGTYFGTPTPSWNPAGAILVAISHLPPGGVILLEQQWDYADPNTGGADFVPLEFYTDTFPAAQSANTVYSAIQLAAANNLYVVEAAGNGNYDLNSLAFAGDSGAIIVGAGGAYPGGFGNAGNLERLDFSSYGFRVNVQGWGENVTTTGYGDLYVQGPTNNYDYTAVFNGTSSASAHVAATVACYSAFITPALGALSATTMRDRLALSGTSQEFGNPGYIGPRPDLMRLFVYDAPPVLANGGDFGDAPDGVEAYPGSGVLGDFHSVFVPGLNPYDAMFHGGGLQAFLGSFIDYEWGGNGGLPYGGYYTYDADECYDPGVAFPDDGLLFPPAYTIQGGAVTSCNGAAGDLGPACGLAQWGTDIDITVTSQVPSWLNVLVDWNGDGQWGGTDAGCGTPAPELAVANISIPSTSGATIPLSQLVGGLPPVRIGSTEGYVWARFSLTDAPAPTPLAWNGSLVSGGWVSYPQGETEDYLLRVGAGATAVAEAAAIPDTPAAAFPNPFRTETTVRFATRTAAADVSVDLFDVRGRRLRRIVAGRLDAGTHQVTWDGTDTAGHRVSPGVYFARVSGAGRPETVRLALIR
jgi:serine protease